MNLFTIALSLFLFTSVQADAYWNAESNSFIGSTSDKIDYLTTTLELKHDPSDFFWPYKNKSQNEWGVKARWDTSNSNFLDSQYSEIQLHKAWSSKKSKIKLEVGSGQIKSGDSSTHLVGSLKYERLIKKKFQFSLDIAKAFAAPVILPLNSFPSFAFTKKAHLRLKYQLGKKIDLQVQQRTDLFSDSNTRNWFDSEIMYAISRFPTWARIGFGASYLKFKTQDPRFWSPQKVFSYGPRIDLSMPLYKKLSFFTGGSLNFFQEDDFTPGDGHYARLGLSHGGREDLKASFFIEDSRSTQNNNVWDSRFYNVNVGYTW